MHTPVTTQPKSLTFTSPYERNNFAACINNPTVRDIVDVLPEFDPASEISVTVEQFVATINNPIGIYR